MIMIYEHYVIVTKRESIDLGPPSMDVIVLFIVILKKNS